MQAVKIKCEKNGVTVFQSKKVERKTHTM